jgi:NifU-like protein involved in Fe-S cluster formation
MDAPLYNARILRLAAAIPHGERLENPQASVRRTSQICGSRVIADVQLGPDGRVTAFGQEVRACALGQAAASILGQSVIGETAESLAEAHELLKAWLKGSGTLPAPLAERFPDLELFEPARPHPARHPSILLAFEASAAAAAEAADGTAARAGPLAAQG